MRFSLQVAALLLGAAVSAARAGDVLTVDSVAGEASLDRLGTHTSLKAGDQLSERDVVRVSAGGSLTLDFSGHGFVEVGPGAEFGIEKMPFASYADDLKTIFSLTHGYLRVVWKLSPLAGRWPLYVYFGSQHAALIPGEYFFDNQSGVARACVAAGHLSVLPNAGTELQKLRPSACYRFVAGLPPERVAHDASAWIAVRRSFDIDAPTSPEAMLAASDAGSGDLAADPVPAPVPRPTVALPKPPVAPALAKPAVSVLAAPKADVAASSPPAAAAAAAPSLPPGGSGEWGVNVASYPTQEDANKHMQQLRAAGYAATVQQALVNDHTWFRVQLKGYPSADAARAVAGELQARFAYQGLWVNKTGPAGAPAP
ncbi:MAG: hypothetical protein JWR07_1618 [Nevskia sp.]|nr:hypothetical protein [Nevskia sp.]